MKTIFLLLSIAFFSCTKTQTPTVPQHPKTRNCQSIIKQPITLEQFNTYEVYSYTTCMDFPSMKCVRTYSTNKGTVTGNVANFTGIDCPIYCDTQIPSNLILTLK